MGNNPADERLQIVIPMSGFGERFRRKGYSVPKPLIEVDGLPIIAHVINLFPGETDFIFICNQDHLDNPDYSMAETLARHCPTGRVFGIEPHELGPVYALSQIFDHLAPNRPVIANYCDFTCYWDYPAFKRFVQDNGCDGAIPAYRGFHPHSQGSTFYAYMKESQGWVHDIQEKQPFTDRPMEEYASSGTYYFSSASLMIQYCNEALDTGLKTGDEYYVSLVYKPMFRDRRRVSVYPLQHFMQWGTPEDLEDYTRWSSAFRSLCKRRPPPARHPGTVLMPMAGAGARFTKDGYTTPKPLIPVSGKPMVVQAAKDLPRADTIRFVLRDDLPGVTGIRQILAKSFPASEFWMLDGLTDGQARTCVKAAETLAPDAPLTIGACDNGLVYDTERLRGLLQEGGPDVLVWAVRGHAGAIRQPQMYGWIETDGDRVTGVSVKQALDDPATDPIIVGAFTFRKTRYFLDAANRLFERDGRINGEFYVDSCIEDAIAMGLDCRLFEVDSYLCWGTPGELKTFEYWQSCFHKWPYHPYRLEDDPTIPSEAVAGLAERYAAPPAGTKMVRAA